MSFHEPIPQNTHPASGLQVNFSSAELPVYGHRVPVTPRKLLDKRFWTDPVASALTKR
jgi:hypothetical protein